MKVLILNGSPRKHGNTSELTKAIARDIIGRNSEPDEIMLFVKNILGCNNCGSCQKDRLPARCSINDDMIDLYQKFLDADLVILASPIYMWQMTPCAIAFLNRLHCLCGSSDFVYNEMKGKKLALALTMGDDTDVAEFAIGGIIEFCKFFMIDYKGSILIPFADREKIATGESNGDIARFLDNAME